MWIANSLIMFFGSVLLYLLIRRAQQQKIDTQVYSFFIFAIPALTYLVSAVVTDVKMTTSPQLFVIIAFSALIWSYLGNFFSQQGILLAPNPGYSLMIAKSYVVITTVAAVFIFGSELTLIKGLAILVILLFSGLISISNGQEKHKANSLWVVFSIGAHLCFAYGSLISKYFLQMNLSPIMYLFYITAIVALINLVKSRKIINTKLLFSKKIYILLGIGLASVIFNTFQQFAYQTAPNPGYVAAINVSSILIVTYLSHLIFKDHLSFSKIIGMLGVCLGLGLLFIS